MTSVIVPPVDLAPGMPSRVVTISATDVTEGGQSLAGQMVRFALSGTLDVASGGDVIAKTQAEVVLDADGNGSIRLPVYDEGVRTWCGQDWAVLVTATWGSQKAIRVPAGTSPIALSSLPNIRPLRGRELQWAITGVSVTVSEGGSWDVSSSWAGGIFGVHFSVPHGGVAWHKGQLAAGTDLNELDTPEESGIYTLSSSGAYQNAPAIINGLPAVLMVSATGFSGEQEIAMYSSTYKLRRVMNNSATRPRGWTAWERIDVTGAELDALNTQVGAAHKFHGTAPSGNLDGYRFASQSGSWGLSSSNTYTNLPPILGAFGGAILMVDSTGFGDTVHTVQYRFDGGRYTRAETSAGNFSAWRRIDYPDRQQHERELELIDGRAELAESATPILPMIETSGLWTTYGAGEALIERVVRRNYPRRTITNPLDVKILGTTVLGRRITAIIHGDPTLPALYVQAGVHGDETSSREAALKLSIDLSVGPIMDGYCVIIVATVNADMANIRRTNAINADLNRRWTAGQEQPENLAVKTLFANYDIRAVLDCHEGGTPDQTQFAINEIAGDITTSQLIFDTAAAAVDADPTAFPSSVWVDETRDGAAMEVFPVEFAVPYLLVEMPGGLGEATYWPSTEKRMHSYRVVMDSIHDLFRTSLATFTQ